MYDKRAPGRFLARKGESTVYLSPTEATIVLRPTAGAGRLGRGADLGLPRNARSPHEDEELPEPRRDRAAPRTHTPATLRMQFIGANRHAGVSGEEQLPTRTNCFIGGGRQRNGEVTCRTTRVSMSRYLPGNSAVPLISICNSRSFLITVFGKLYLFHTGFLSGNAAPPPVRLSVIPSAFILRYRCDRSIPSASAVRVTFPSHSPSLRRM